MMSILILIAVVTTVVASPTYREKEVSHSVLYDESQRGDSNAQRNIKNTMFLIVAPELKSTPYNVDVTNTEEQLVKLHPENEELTVSSNAALEKSKVDSPAVRTSRSSRSFVFTAPTEDEDEKEVVKDSEIVVKETPTKHTLELLGAENEQCGPEMERDVEGICRTSKTL